jgi:hypothetical protein
MIRQGIRAGQGVAKTYLIGPNALTFAVQEGNHRAFRQQLIREQTPNAARQPIDIYDTKTCPIMGHVRGTPTAARSYPRKTPPVALVTFSMILAETAAIASSVSV